MAGHTELVFFEGCPHAEQTRARLRDAFMRVGLPATWDEWDTLQERTPARYRNVPSPTVLIDGVDVTGGGAGTGPCCAVSGGPTTAQILNAMRTLSET